jgi:IS5 family transposase
VVVNGSSKEVMCTAHGRGRVHDFALYKQSQLDLHENLELLADTGYQGISKLHGKSRTPKKRSKKRQLTKDERRANRELSQRRIVVENVIRSLKIFRILLERYRNRRKRFSLRFNLIAGLYNFELNL